MTVKEKILKAVQEMPPDVTFDELLEQLHLLYKIEQGLQQVETSDAILNATVKQQLQEAAKRDLELAQEWFN